MNQTTYEIIINPLKNIKSFQHQIEQVSIIKLRKQKCHQNRKDYSIGGLSSILINHWLITVSKKVTLSNLSQIKFLQKCHITPLWRELKSTVQVCTVNNTTKLKNFDNYNKDWTDFEWKNNNLSKWYSKTSTQ